MLRVASEQEGRKGGKDFSMMQTKMSSPLKAPHDAVQ